jgi:hypothetical protein
MELTIAKCPDQKMALTNCVYLSPSDLERLGGSAEEVYLEIKGFVFTARATREVESNTIGVNSIHRRMLGSNGDPVTVSVFSPGASESVGLAAATIECDYLQKVKARGDEKVDGEELVRSIVSRLSSQFLTVRQHIAMDYRGDNLLLTVTSLEAAGGEPGASMRGILVSSSEVLPQKAPGSLMVISGLASASAAKTNIFRAEFNFEKMGARRPLHARPVAIAAHAAPAPARGGGP